MCYKWYQSRPLWFHGHTWVNWEWYGSVRVRRTDAVKRGCFWLGIDRWRHRSSKEGGLWYPDLRLNRILISPRYTLFFRSTTVKNSRIKYWSVRLIYDPKWLSGIMIVRSEGVGCYRWSCYVDFCLLRVPIPLFPFLLIHHHYRSQCIKSNTSFFDQ
jgi:hypothetical protein